MSSLAWHFSLLAPCSLPWALPRPLAVMRVHIESSSFVAQEKYHHGSPLSTMGINLSCKSDEAGREFLQLPLLELACKRPEPRLRAQVGAELAGQISASILLNRATKQKMPTIASLGLHAGQAS